MGCYKREFETFKTEWLSYTPRLRTQDRLCFVINSSGQLLASGDQGDRQEGRCYCWAPVPCPRCKTVAANCRVCRVQFSNSHAQHRKDRQQQLERCRGLAGTGWEGAEWIRVWLEDRKQRVVLNGEASECADVLSVAKCLLHLSERTWHISLYRVIQLCTDTFLNR